MSCEREWQLYPEPKVKELAVGVYKEALTALQRISKQVHKPLIRKSSHAEELQSIRQKVSEHSAKVIREVEYLHRRELRDAHIRLREVDRKQDQVIRALEEQKRILESLQEEQQLMKLVSDNQKVLQMLQQLLARFNHRDIPSEAGSVDAKQASNVEGDLPMRERNRGPNGDGSRGFLRSVSAR